jgi:hypothetical protein
MIPDVVTQHADRAMSTPNRGPSPSERLDAVRISTAKGRDVSSGPAAGLSHCSTAAGPDETSGPTVGILATVQGDQLVLVKAYDGGSPALVARFAYLRSAALPESGLSDDRRLCLSLLGGPSGGARSDEQLTRVLGVNGSLAATGGRT